MSSIEIVFKSDLSSPIVIKFIAMIVTYLVITKGTTCKNFCSTSRSLPNSNPNTVLGRKYLPVENANEKRKTLLPTNHGEIIDVDESVSIM